MGRIIEDVIFKLSILLVVGILVYLGIRWLRLKLVKPAITATHIVNKLPNPVDLLFPIKYFPKGKSSYITDSDMRIKAKELLRLKKLQGL